MAHGLCIALKRLLCTLEQQQLDVIIQARIVCAKNLFVCVCAANMKKLQIIWMWWIIHVTDDSFHLEPKYSCHKQPVYIFFTLRFFSLHIFWLFPRSIYEQYKTVFNNCWCVIRSVWNLEMSRQNDTTSTNSLKKKTMKNKSEQLHDVS